MSGVIHWRLILSNQHWDVLLCTGGLSTTIVLTTHEPISCLRCVTKSLRHSDETLEKSGWRRARDA